MKINHFGLTVGNIEEGVEFYTSVFDLTVLVAPGDHTLTTAGGDRRADVFGPDWGHMKLAHLADDTGVGIELFEFVIPETTPSDTGFNYRPTGISHVAFTVDDLEGTIAKIVALGGRARTAIHQVSTGTRICYCEDPWGTAVEICTTSYAELAGVPFTPREDQS